MSAPRPNLPTFGPATPPAGFVAFNTKTREDHPKRVVVPAIIQIEPEIWSLIRELNAWVNGSVRYQRNDTEEWAYPVNAIGDCRGIALLKRRVLTENKIPRPALALAAVLDSEKRGHVVVVMRTNRGEFVLDNQHNEVRHWSRARVEFLMRQEYGCPAQWVALSPLVAQLPGVTS